MTEAQMAISPVQWRIAKIVHGGLNRDSTCSLIQLFRDQESGFGPFWPCFLFEATFSMAGAMLKLLSLVGGFKWFELAV